MRVLGVDPGLTRCGLGVVDGAPAAATMVAVGVVRTPSDADPGERLVFLERELDGVARPASTPRSSPSSGSSPTPTSRTVMTTAHATAVALLTATKRGIPVVFHTPTEVKAAVTGSGRADKAQVTAMVTRILGLERGGPAGRCRRRAGAGHLPRLARRPVARLDALAGAGAPVIASVRGPVAHVGLDHVVVEVGGVGMLVHTTPATASRATGGARRRWRPASWSARTR